MKELFTKIFLSLITGICGYAATQLNDLTKTVSSLNANVGVLIERTTTQGVRMDRFEHRLDAIEMKK